MSELPQGWAEAPIGSLCSLNNGRAFKPTEWSTYGLPIVRIQNLNNPDAPFNHFHGEFENRYHLRGGELLFAWSGTPGTSFGAHVWRGGEAVLNQHIFRVDFNEATLDKRFFRYAINQKLDELIDIAHGGVGLRHVTKGTFEGTLVAVPPLKEQKRIADKLDAILARVDACRERLDRVPAILKRFRQAVLATATSGKLTEEWRVRHVAAVPERESTRYRLRKLADLVKEPMRHGKSVRDGDGLRVLRLSALKGGKIDWAETKRGAWGAIDSSRFLIKEGDFLVARGNGSRDLVGRGALVVGPPPAVAFPDTMIRVRPSNAIILPSFLRIIWDIQQVRDQIEFAARTTAGIWKIAQTDLEDVELPVPLVEEQDEIVRRVEVLFAYADRLETRYTAARAQVERLMPALLAKAFRGQLVPQDPNDDLAPVLLERIRASRAAAGEKPPRKVRTKRKTMIPTLTTG